MGWIGKSRTISLDSWRNSPQTPPHWCQAILIEFAFVRLHHTFVLRRLTFASASDYFRELLNPERKIQIACFQCHSITFDQCRNSFGHRNYPFFDGSYRFQLGIDSENRFHRLPNEAKYIIVGRLPHISMKWPSYIKASTVAAKCKGRHIYPMLISI